VGGGGGAGGAFSSGYMMPSHFFSLPLPWATDEQVQGEEQVIALARGTQNHQPVGGTGQDQGGGGVSKGQTERGLCRLREIVGGFGDGYARHTYTHAQIHTQMEVTPEELIGIRAAVAEMEWVLLSRGLGKGGRERDGKGHDTPLSLHSPSPPCPDHETVDRFQALAELLEMQLNSTSAELSDLRVRCGAMEDETSVLSEKLSRYEDIVAKVQGDIMVERNLRLALASVFDDLSRLLREVLKGVSAFNATAAAARETRDEGAAAGGGGGAADGGGRASESQVVGLEASPMGLGGVSSGVLQVSPAPSTVVAAVSLIAGPPSASELAAEAVSAASERAVIGAMTEFARKLEEEWRLQLQELETHGKLVLVNVTGVVTGDCDRDESEDLRAMLVVMRQKEKEREEARERERAQEKYAREELGKSIKYLEIRELADAAIREQLSDGLEQMAQESEALGIALKSRDEYIAKLLEQQQAMKEQEMTLSQEVSQVSAGLEHEVAECNKVRDSLTYVRWVLAGRVLPQVSRTRRGRGRVKREEVGEGEGEGEGEGKGKGKGKGEGKERGGRGQRGGEGRQGLMLCMHTT
jgi:hypothetical protein